MSGEPTPGLIQAGIGVMLAQELERRGNEWDEEPALCGIQIDHEPPVRLRWGQFPFTRAIWDAWETPVHALSSIARGLQEQEPSERPVPPGGLYAVAFRCEAWAVPDAPPGTAQASENAADALGHRLKHRADRIELRTFQAVDLLGSTYLVEQPRGERPVQKIRYPNEIAFDGDVYRALDKILHLLTGSAALGPRWA